MSPTELATEPNQAAPTQSLNCWESFRFLNENPNWFINILVIAACQLIPIAGQIATMGYQFEIAEALLRPARPRGYPDFDFNRLLDYLLRGLWPFLTGLVVSLALMIPLTLLMAISMAGVLAIEPEQLDSMPVITAMSLVVCLFVLTISAGNIIMTAMMLRAGYCQNVMDSFDLRFTRDFLRLMWKETIVTLMFLTFVFLPLMALGGLVFCIGFNIVCGLMVPVQAHLMDYQLYSIYLARGGEPIPVRSRLSKIEMPS